jgi:hypothetical protein
MKKLIAFLFVVWLLTLIEPQLWPNIKEIFSLTFKLFILKYGG